MGLGIWGLVFVVWGFGFRVWKFQRSKNKPGFGVWGQGFGFWVWEFSNKGLRVYGFDRPTTRPTTSRPVRTNPQLSTLNPWILYLPDDQASVDDL